jgi:hypothetical protein
MKSVHATAHGFIACYDDNGTDKVVAMEYGGDYKVLDEDGRDLAEHMMQQDSDILPAEIREVLENANYAGRSTNFAELKEAELAYSIEDASPTPFEDESLFLNSSNQGAMQLVWPGELRGWREQHKSSTVEDSDPLTNGEAAWLIEKILGEDFSDVSSKSLAISNASYLVPALAEVAEKIQDHLEQVDHHNWCLGRPVRFDDGSFVAPKAKLVPRYIGFYPLLPNAKNNEERDRKLSELIRRVLHTVKGNSLGGPWAHDGIWSTSEREGVTDIMEELAIKGLSPQAQYVDDDLPDLEREEYRLMESHQDPRRPRSALFNQLYDKDGKNRGWSDRSLFFFRKKEERIKNFHALMHAIMTLPEQLVTKHFLGRDSDFQRTYRESIRECSPGPVRKFSNGQWLNLPLSGMEARLYLVRQGFNAFELHPDVRFHRGERWHSVFLDRSMKEELDRAIEIRLKSYSNRLDSRIANMPEEFPIIKREVDQQLTIQG